jgi:hypothetical protein
MKSFKALALSLTLTTLLMSAPKAHAEAAHILSASTSSSLLMTKDSSWSDDYNTYFSLDLGYDYAFDSGLQLGGTFGTQIYSGGSVFSIAMGPGYNFNKDIKNSFFVALNLGVITIHHSDYNSSDTSMYATFEAGKRFKILENVSYTPGLRVEKLLKSDSPDPTFSLDIVKFSLLF